MNSPHNFSDLSPAELAEVQLQAELRDMFVVDTQQHLDSYFSLVGRLTASTWAADIQHIYRAVHTIKGGAVTVEADGVLYAAGVLEDLLSDLRYLEIAPGLSDGKLQSMLQEAGELLASAMEIVATGDRAAQIVGPTTQRIQFLHDLIKQEYLPEWNEQKQLHQEFAEQGFDLVVLDLEMTVERMVANRVTPEMRQIGDSTIEQLVQIGGDIELADDWYHLLSEFQAWLAQADATAWKTHLLAYLQLCKTCVCNSGVLDVTLTTTLANFTLWNDVAIVSEPVNLGVDSDLDIEHCSSEIDGIDLENLELETLELDVADLDDFLLDAIDAPEPLASAAWDLDDGEIDEFSVAPLTDLADDDLLGLTGWDEDEPTLDQTPTLDGEDVTLDQAPTLDEDEPTLDQTPTLDGEDVTLDQAPEADDFSFDETATLEAEAFADDFDLPEFLWEEVADEDLTASAGAIDDRTLDILDDILENDDLFAAAAPTPNNNTAEIRRNLQVPVPLERLDRSAQKVVDTLLSARGVMNLSQKLQFQLAQLTELTDESAQSITHLRQLQDDYALLRHISSESDSDNVSLERYRQGYSTINRLLENILRMSELGREIETSTKQTTNNLEGLDRHILQLKDQIESSRLVPFRNLAMRARAILRDLTNRYGKPAELIIENENLELDAGVVQQLEPVMLHLLRNAYDHGLESAAARSASGKSPQGTIRVSLQRRGNYYNLDVSDDGGGINASEIARKAQLKGFGLTNTGTSAGLLAVLCQPGLTSRDTVNEVSGRGVGMDVVASQIESMGGKLSLQTTLGQGTTFSIEVPAPQLLVSCVLLQVGARIVALPTEEIQEMLLLDGNTTQTADGWKIQLADGSSATAWDLNSYWQQPLLTLSDTTVAIRSRWSSFDSQIPWLIADDLLGQSELLISPLPHPIVSPAGMLGVSVQPDGRLVSVFDPVALLSKLRSQPAAPTIPATTVTAAANAQILVVDDAALMRRRLESSLNTHGFATHTCSDGLEALNWIQLHGLPSILITDIEMPNMDGFTLVDRCRQAGFQMPIVVISSRLSEEWSREAHRLGANCYLNKGFTTPQLIDTVRSMLALQPV
jgi:chemotaxis protein histidine kinase CheA/ActR/RegA family two-component response regulator